MKPLERLRLIKENLRLQDHIKSLESEIVKLSTRENPKYIATVNGLIFHGCCGCDVTRDFIVDDLESETIIELCRMAEIRVVGISYREITEKKMRRIETLKRLGFKEF